MVKKSIRLLLEAYPKGLYILFYTEMWELFGRFGIASLLVLYLTKTFHFSDDKAFMLYSAFLALLYITPIIGGGLCDRILGNRRSIILGASIMIVGNAFLVVPSLICIYAGLAILIIGSGFFLPSIAPLVGRLYDNNNRSRDAGFTLYYLGKNIGALLAPVLCGIVGEYFGFNYAFILSSLGMLSGLIVFIRGKEYLREYDVKSTAHSKKQLYMVYLGAVLVCPFVIGILFLQIDGYLLIATAILVSFVLFKMMLKRSESEKRHVVAILVMMLFVIIFESFLNQGGSSLNLFIDRIVNRHVFGALIPTTVFYSLDPAFMMLLGPILSILWLQLAKRHREPSVILKFVLALFALGTGFGLFVVSALHAKITGQSSLLYVVIAYAVFPLAELCLVPIGLSLVTKLAPRGMEAMLVGVWMLASSMSNYLAGQIAKLGEIKFTLVRLADFQQASGIYMHAFFYMMCALFVAGLTLLVLKPAIRKLFVS